MKTCIMNTLIVIESLTIVNLLNKVQFPFVKVFPPQMLSSSSEGAIVQAVPIAFAPVLAVMGVAVVGGCDSRWRHRLLLESVPGLTHPP